MKASVYLRRRMALAALAVIMALLAISTATFAWYVYNTTARTMKVKMVAGSSVYLEIANNPNGPYSSTTLMESFGGWLTPVSTDKISGGFQKADQFASQSGRVVASHFLSGMATVDYYKTSLYFRTNAAPLDIYLSDIGFNDANDQNPISTAMRLGLVVNGNEYIFNINDEHNPNADDNAARERDGGYVLDSTKTDGTTKPFTPYTKANFCTYNNANGTVTLSENSVKLFTVSGNGQGGYGNVVQVDVYIWLEGCDEDCTINLAGNTVNNLALSFAGSAGEGA